MHDLAADLRYAARMLRRTPVTTLIAIASLGFGVATNTTVFSVASGFLFETFRWRAPEELVFVPETNRNDAGDREAAPGNFLDWKEASTHLEAIEAYTVTRGNLTGGEEPQRIDVVDATPGIFELLGTPPSLGRGFRPDDAAGVGSRSAVLTREFFLHRFAGDPSVLGTSLAIDGEPHTIVGVLPERFDFFPANVEVFRAVDLTARRHDRESHVWLVLGRLAPGSSVHDVQAELSAVAERLEAEFPDTNRGYGVNAQTLRQLFPGETDTRLQYILLTVGAFVLLIASANLVNLFLAKGDARRAELALRLALGAGRRRLGRQLLTESLLVGALGGVVGILGSIYWVRSVASFMPAELPEVFYPRLDGLVLAYGVVVSLVAGALLGIAPALQASRVAPAVALGENTRGGSGSQRRRRLRASFIVAETAVALALLTAAGIMTDTFETMVRENGSVDVENVLTLDLTADENRFPEDGDVVAFTREIARRLSELPGVESTAALTTLPRSRDDPRTQFTIDGRPAPSPTEAPWTGWQAVTPGYFATLRLPIVDGRALEPSDREDAAPVVVVNQRFARLHFPEQEALGRRLTLFGASREIVGICADFVQPRIPAVDGASPAVYLPFDQHPVRTMSIAARVGGDPMLLAERARQAVWAVDPEQPVDAVQTLRSHIDTSLAGPRVIAQALTIMGAVAILLSAIGMYGLIAHDVAQRRREIGIRMALGAAPSRVVATVTVQGMSIAALGMALGVPAAWAMTRAIAAAFQDMAALRLGSIAILVALLAAVALVASSLPAIGAARIRPARVLQGD